ncbi:MAG: ferritin-like domain-containing protein, partial [Chloroflexota bacterium]
MPESSSPSAKVTTRLELIHLLSRAADLEHSLMCQYLFTAFTLKRPGDAGISLDQARMTERWFGTIMHVAVEEMRHLAQVCNLLTAVGGAPLLRSAGFPRYANSYTFGLEAKLAPFSLETIRRYVCWEKPEGAEEPACDQPIQLARLNPAGAAYYAHLADVMNLIPGDLPYRSIGELYTLIDTAFSTIPARDLFIGPRSAQVTNARVPFREPLTAITAPDHAHRAIHLIVVEGEGTPSDKVDAHKDTSHFARFLRIAAELEQELGRDPHFAPARPV